VWAYLDETESRFRPGDLLRLHLGHPSSRALAAECSFELEEDDRWLLRTSRALAAVDDAAGRPCWADPDSIDLSATFERALEDVATSEVGQNLILPLLAGERQATFHDGDSAFGREAARAAGFNEAQAEAVALGLGANELACVQGPPGTGKTRVLAFLVKLMVERGDQVLVTAHTHTAIHNALNAIAAHGVPTVKVSAETQRAGLHPAVAVCESLAGWADRPSGSGYVVGATPFATSSGRLAGWHFDSVVFDEASQITVPLALMAMRAGGRYVFVGDEQQLPPVVLARSILDLEPDSVFARLTDRRGEHSVMLTDTYRMNRWLAEWPSRSFYRGKLRAVGANRDRPCAVPLLDEASAVFVPTRDPAGRARNQRDAELVRELCLEAARGGLAPAEMAVVTPFRAQGRLVRNLLAPHFGRGVLMADTVERMQGQERELVILSLAAADPAYLGAIAEFFFQPQRLNVSVTRARTKLIVIGPDLPALPALTDPVLRGWVERYADLVRSCGRAA
jgi:DNA replication ATP-dependent helicase Dna2